MDQFCDRGHGKGHQGELDAPAQVFFDSDHIPADLKIPMLIVGINEQVVRRLARLFGRANCLVSFCGFGFLCG
jgi:hypothetical protein